MKKVKSFSIKHKYLELIKQNKKTLEVRMATPFFQSIRKGDIVILYDEEGNVVRVQIIDIRVYNTFEEMLRYENYKKCFQTFILQRKLLQYTTRFTK